MKIFFYVQHLLGIGHLARASRIGAALVKDGFDLTVVSGGLPVKGFPGERIRFVQLPPIRARDITFSGLIDDQGHPVDDAYKSERRARLLAAFDECTPDAVMIEAFPFGRWQMRFELTPLLEAVERASPRPLIVSSIRDILQARLKPGRAEGILDLLKRHFDLVLVHGDEKFVRLEDTFPLARRISDRIAYTGLVTAPIVPAQVKFDAIVSAGGGATGYKHIIAAAEAARTLIGELPSWCILTGPNLPAHERDALTRSLPPGVKLEVFRVDFPGLLARAKISISQAGYNTVCDILRAGCRAVLVPFAGGEETEQAQRAMRLKELGIAEMIDENDLSPQRIIDAVRAAPIPPAHGLDLDGAAGTARALRKALSARRGRSA